MFPWRRGRSTGQVASIAPGNGHTAVVGLDLASEATCAAALEEVGRSGLVGATPPVALMHDPSGQQAILAFQPLHVPEGAAVAGGFAGCALRPQAILNRVLDCNPEHDPYLKVSLVDLMAPEGPAVLAEWPSPASGAASGSAATLAAVDQRLDSVQPVFVFGRSWALVTRPAPHFFDLAESWEGPVALLTGLLLTATVTAFVGLLRRRQASLEEQVLRRTQELRERENDLAVTLQSIGEAVIATDTEARITHMNPMAERLTGWPLAEALGRPLEEVCRLLHAMTGQTVPNPVEEALRSETAVTPREERILVAREGTCWPVADSAAPIREAGGTIRGAVLIVHDVTEAVRARQTIREGELRLEMILQSVEVGIVVIDPLTHELVDANRKALALMGASRDEVVGAVCHRHLCPGTRSCPVTDLGQHTLTAEKFLLTAQGGKIPILKTVVPMQIRGRSFLVESFVDITDRKRMEESLQAATERLQAVINTSPLAMVLLDALGTVLSWNPAAEQMLGWKEAEVRTHRFPFVPQAAGPGARESRWNWPARCGWARSASAGARRVPRWTPASGRLPCATRPTRSWGPL